MTKSGNIAEYAYDVRLSLADVSIHFIRLPKVVRRVEALMTRLNIRVEPHELGTFTCIHTLSSTLSS